MSLENLLAIQRWFHRAYTLREPGALELIDEHVVTHWNRQLLPGRAAWRASWMRILEAYPELHIGVEDACVEGEWVAVRARAVGRHRNGARVDFRGGGFFRYRAGRCVEGWNSWDFLTALIQSGHVPAGGLAACFTGEAPAPRGGPVSLHDPDATPEAAVRRWFEEAYARRNARAPEELIAEDVVAHGLNQELHGRRQFADAFWRPFVTSFDPVQVALEQVIPNGDRVAVRARVTGVHRPSGREVDFEGGGFAHTREGQLIVGWNCWDFLTLLRQTGHVAGDPLAEVGL